MLDPQCAKCPNMYCSSGPMEKLNKNALPEYCPMCTNEDTIRESREQYGVEDVKKLYVPSTITEKEAYQTVRGTRMAVRPRIKELIELAKLLEVEKIGIAFCAGLKNEASRLTEFLENNDFKVASALCKCGGTDKTELGVKPEHKIGDSEKFEAGCNPILQAKLLNKAETGINVIVGLCIGHDMLFTMNSEAPVTTLVVKDRLLGHNPVIGLFSQYHEGIIEKQDRT